MSEAPKTVEAPVVSQPSTDIPAVVDTTPATTESEVPAVQPSTETPVVEEAAKETEVAAPVKEEVKPVEEGVLGYKGPGLLKSFIFQKKFFWFGTDAVESKHLTSYLRGEKDAAAANHNAAWASHTGNGLLFLSKKHTDKASPAGVFNLSDVADLTNEGTVEFHFLSGGHKHTFQAASLAERDNWVSVLKTKIDEAKSLVESVKESEEYKKNHSALTKPVVAAVAAPKKVEEEKKQEAKEEKKEEKEEKKEEKKEIKEEDKEEKKVEKARKSRSASRKRASIFGGFGGKKEEKAEVTKDAAAAPAVEEPVVAGTEQTPVVDETPAITEPVSASAEPTTQAEQIKPTPTKRNSIFGTLKSQFSQNKVEKKTDAPALPAKDDAEPVSQSPPVIPQVEHPEPLATSEPLVSEAAPVDTATPATNGETKIAETPTVKSDKRKSSLPWLTKKEKPTSEDEAEKPKSPFAKLRATVKGKSSPKTEKTEKVASTKEEPSEAAPAVEEPVASSTPATSAPAASAPATTPQVTASA